MVAVPESFSSVPETRYARNGEEHIAYQDFGEGGLTFVALPDIVSNIEVGWEDPEARRWLTDLASFARVVDFDKRGQGVSDRHAGVLSLDDRLGDLAAVLDAVGLDCVALGEVSEGGPTAAMFAATYPERVSHLCVSTDRLRTSTWSVVTPFGLRVLQPRSRQREGRGRGVGAAGCDLTCAQRNLLR
jgi:pimeloyl-ACP methyl ester carboxylesterase